MKPALIRSVSGRNTYRVPHTWRAHWSVPMLQALPYVLLLLCAGTATMALISLAATSAHGQGLPIRAKGEVEVRPARALRVSVNVRKDGAIRHVALACVDRVPGLLRNGSYAHIFTPINAVLRSLRRKGATKAKIEYNNRLLRAGTTACSTAVPREIAMPEVGAVSAHETLTPVQEATTPEMINVLCNRFLFGCSPAQRAHALEIGLPAFVDEVTTLVADPEMEVTTRADMYCDSSLQVNPNDRCTDGSKAKFSRYGVLAFESHRILFGQNQFFDKFMFFLHDERMAASMDTQGAQYGCGQIAVPLHFEMLERAARSGDYKQFMKEWTSDMLGHLFWLNGADNNKLSPNENFAREFWELGTLAPTDLAGNANYTELDVARAALAFTGWSAQPMPSRRFISTDNMSPTNPAPVVIGCAAKFSKYNHSKGAKVIFFGTPYQSTVYDHADILEATFKHHALAESLALDLWHEFISPNPTVSGVRNLAALIRANNYQLLPVMRTMMLSEALYAPEHRHALIKHPIELVAGLTRALSLTPSRIEQTTDRLTMGQFISYTAWSASFRLRQTFLQPETVFGWNPLNLASELSILDWSRFVPDFIGSIAPEYRYPSGERYEILGYLFPEYQGEFLEVTPDALIDRVVTLLSSELNSQQRAELLPFLNNYESACYYVDEICSEDDVTNRVKHLRPTPFAEQPLQRRDARARGLVTLLVSLPQYRIK